jgi:hypothetical protein
LLLKYIKKPYLCTAFKESSFRETVLQCGNSSVGRAQPCQGWGREFESRFPLKSKDTIFNLFEAQVAELADALVSGTSSGNIVQVQVLSWARKSFYGEMAELVDALL